MLEFPSVIEVLKLILQAIQIATTIWIAQRNRKREP